MINKIINDWNQFINIANSRKYLIKNNRIQFQNKFFHVVAHVAAAE